MERFAGLFLLGFWIGGAFIALAFFRVSQPLAFLVMSLWWGIVGSYAAAMAGGWPMLALVAVILIWLCVRIGRVAAN